MHASTYIDFTNTSTTREYPLGEERREYDSTYGWRTYRYIKNDDGSNDLEVGMLAVTDAGDTFFEGKLSDTAALPKTRCLGIAVAEIADGSYGWVVCKGRVVCLGDGAVAEGESVVSHTGGALDTVGAGEDGVVIGVAETDDAALTLLFTAYIDCE